MDKAQKAVQRFEKATRELFISAPYNLYPSPVKMAQMEKRLAAVNAKWAEMKRLVEADRSSRKRRVPPKNASSRREPADG